MLLTIDLNLMPTTLDLWHVCLLITVFVLSFILIIVLLSMIAWRGKKPQAINASTVKPSNSAKIKIVEKIVQAPAQKPIMLKESSTDAALQLLGLLQKEARFIDFLKEDVSAYGDADIGIAARVVHKGCNKVMNDYFTLNTLRLDPEGSKVTLAKGFDASEVRLTGSIVGEAPFTGTLIHKGWKASDVRLPKLTQGYNVSILAVAEVEL